MKLRWLIPAGLAALLFGLVVNLPAALVAAWVQGSVPGLQMAGVTGTALDGRAQQVRYQNTVISNVRWHWHPLALLGGHAAAHVQAAAGSGSLRADVSAGLFGGIEVRHAQGNALLSELAQMGGYSFVPLDGSLQINDFSASLDGQKLQHASGKLVLDNSRWLLLRPPLALGQFNAQLNGDGKTNTLKLLDSHGPLAIEGQASITPAGAYRLNVRLRARAGADKRLKQMLQQLGKPDAEGWYHVRENGRL